MCFGKVLYKALVATFAASESAAAWWSSWSAEYISSATSRTVRIRSTSAVLKISSFVMSLIILVLGCSDKLLINRFNSPFGTHLTKAPRHCCGEHKKAIQNNRQTLYFNPQSHNQYDFRQSCPYSPIGVQCCKKLQ